MSTSEPLVFNPFDPDFRADPYPTYRRLREEDPIHTSILGPKVLTQYELCSSILRDYRTGSDETKSNAYADWVAQGNEPLVRAEDASTPFLFLDPPDHTRLRGLVSKAFTPKVVEGLRPRAQQLTDDLIDAAAARGQMDVIGDFAYLLPVTIISEMLGVPVEDHETFKGWSRELARALDPEFVLPPEVIEARQRASDEFMEYFRRLIAQRRSDPRDDLLSALVAVEEQGDTLTEAELLSTLILLLIAGHETTVNLIGNGVLALLRNRAQFEKLAADPTLAKSATEEVLRYDAPVQMTMRVAHDELRFGDFAMGKGEAAILLVAAANRDPAMFDDPETFDITRDDSRHLAFSSGIHFCLGASLARLEGQVALATLARRLPTMELAVDRPEYKENIVLRGLAALPVTF
ncbi:MAG: cytochrome P450 [Actinobacteria bacterium]|nr:cytochrome P450 [Actinomycetota bacterium]